MIDIIAEIPLLLGIAARAIEADTLAHIAAIQKADLNQAYVDHKERAGCDHVERGTPEWEAMLVATAVEYAASQNAKREANNAARRLKTAIRRFNKIGGAA